MDGASVQRVGDITFGLCKDLISDILLVPEGKVSSTILQLYNEDAIVAEPAGALSIAALDQYATKLQGQKVVCIVSGGNNDIDRMQEIGGGLCAGVGEYFRTLSPSTKIIGVEPAGAPSMKEALKAGKPVKLEKIQRFVDGASVQRVGDITFGLCKDLISDILLVPEGKVSSTILQLYNEDAIVAEPAGALSIAALDQYATKLQGQKVVCIVSGGNNDIDRMQEIMERSLLYEGLKHYFIVRFAQRPGALKEFVNYILGPDDDIVRFEFIQKHNKESGPALIGIEVKSKADFQSLIDRMDAHKLNYTLVNQNENLFEYLV